MVITLDAIRNFLGIGIFETTYRITKIKLMRNQLLLK